MNWRLFMVTELQHHVSLDSGPCASDRVQVVPVLWFRGEAEGDRTVTLVRARLAVGALPSGHAVAESSLKAAPYLVGQDRFCGSTTTVQAAGRP